MENQKSGFFKGLKKMIFKDEAGTPLPLTEGSSSSQDRLETNDSQQPVKTFDVNVTPEAKEDAAKRAYQLIESLNKPGVDFFEVWNAVEENGGAKPATLKQAFNTLKYADKTLTKDKLLESGNFYKSELQKALDGDILKKENERKAIEENMKQSKAALVADINSLELNIKTMQASLADKQKQLGGIGEKWLPQLQNIEDKIQTGKQAIEGVIAKMEELLKIAERELQ